MPEGARDDGAREILLNQIDHHWDEIHHVEEQRVHFSSMVLLIVSAGLGYFFGNEDAPRKVLAWLLIVVGIFGMLAVGKMFERYCFSQGRLDEWYRQLDEMYPEARFLRRRAVARKRHLKGFRPRWMLCLKVNNLWLFVHFFVTVIGEALLLLLGLGWKP